MSFFTAKSRQLRLGTAAKEKEKNGGGRLDAAVGYAAEKFGLGVVQSVEGASDFVVGGVADLVGADEYAEQVMRDDWVDYGHADKWYNPSGAMKVVGDVAGGLGSTVPTLATAAGAAALTYFTGGAAAPAAIKAVGVVAAPLIAGLGAGGNATKEAYMETGDLGLKEWGYGTLSGATEAGVEALTAGIGKGAGRLISGMTKKAMGEATEAVGKYSAKSVLKTLGGDMISEGFEEGFATFMSPIYARWTYDPDAEMATADEVLYDAFIGGMSGLIMGGTQQSINFGSSVSAGKKISEAGNADKMVTQATYGLAQIRVQMDQEDSLTARINHSDASKLAKYQAKRQLKKTAENRKAAAAAIEEALFRWESLTPAERSSVKGFEVLGDLQKNDFLMRANAWVEMRVNELSQQSDEELIRVAAQLREEAGESYTVEELRADKSYVLTRIAVGELALKGFENSNATQDGAQSAQNAAQGAESGAQAAQQGVGGAAVNGAGVSGAYATSEANKNPSVGTEGVRFSGGRDIYESNYPNSSRQKVDSTRKVRYNGKVQGIYIDDKREYAILAQALSAKNGRNPRRIEYAYTDSNFYVVADNSYGRFCPILQLDIVANQALINMIEREIDYGTDQDAKTITEWITALRRGERSDHWDHGRTSGGGRDVRADVLYGRQPRSNAGGYSLQDGSDQASGRGSVSNSPAQAGEDAAQGAESDGLTEWEGLRDNDDMTPYGARSEAEGYLLAAAAREGVPRASIPAMMEAYRAGTSLSPEEFVDGWLDAVKLYGNGAAGHTSYAADSALGRMTESQRTAAMEQGRLYGEAQARAKAKAEGKAQTDTDAKAEAKKEKTSDGAEGRKYSADSSITEYSEYDKPITLQDVEVLRSILRKSINKFTSKDLKKAQKWAYKLYKDLGVKSPFFRAWFGEWRAHQKKADVVLATIPEYVASNEARKQNRGNVTNSDTGWNIRISREGETNTIAHAGAERLSEYGLAGIRELVQNAILLDTEVHEHHDNNAKNDLIAFDHKLYALGENPRGEIALYRITVEDYFQSKSEPSNKRFHNLKYIEKIADVPGGRTFGQNRSGGSTNGQSTITYSISDLYGFVKQFDKEFSAAPEVNEMLLNEDGTPKVFYHGTDAKFEAFDPTEIAAWEDSFFFAENRKDAEAYGKNVYEVYLTGRNLADYDNQPIEFYKFRSKREQVAWLKGRGYDGWYADMDSDGWGELSVFSPEQIKSATDNIGTFDGSESNIRWSGAGVSEGSSVTNEKPMKRTTRKGVPGVVLADGLNVRNDFSDRQYASYKAAELMAKVLGVDIVFHRSLHHGADVAAGYFSPKDGSIHININAMRDGQNIALYTLGHETVHYIKEWSPRKYAELESFVLRKLTESGQDVKALEEAKRAQLEKSGDLEGLKEEQADALVREEVVAEAMEGVLSDGEVLADLQKRHRSLWEKIRDFVLSVIDKVKAAFNDLSGASQTARVLRDTVDALDGMKQLFYEGVVGAAEARANGAEGSTGLTRRNAGKMQVSNQYDFTKSFAEQVDDYKNQQFPKGDSLLVCETPETFRKVGFNALPMTINQTHVDYALNGTKNADHNIGESLLKQLPTTIQNPVAIITSKSPTGGSTSVVALLSIKHNGKQIIAPVFIDGFGFQNSIMIDSNAITSVHARGNAISNFLISAIADEANGKIGVFYWNKKEALALLPNGKVIVPNILNASSDGFIHSIRDKGSPVKPKFKNVTESQQFIRWFGNWLKHPKTASKIVNKDGTPKILYHQTDADISVFDPRQKGAGTTDDETPFGIFMKPTDTDIGLKGKKQMALYARIVNPLEVANRHELAQKLRTLSPEYARLKDEISALSVEYQAKIDQAAKDQERYVEEYKEAHPDSPSSDIYNDQRFNELFDAEDHLVEEWETKANSLAVQCKEEITKALKENDYDGVIIHQDAGSFGRSTETYIALDPKQVKSATDNMGTYDGTNPDIHWSAGGDITESTDVSENASPYFKAAVERAGIDPESAKMIRSIEDSSKDLREDERAAWQADVERLGSYVKAQKAAAVSPAFTPKAMENAVGKVMSVIGAKRGRAELTERMTELYRHIATSDTLTYEDIMERAEAIADELIEAQPPTPVPVDGVYGDILTDLKQTPMTLTSTQMQEVADRYGSYENFRRKMFGKWKLSKDGVALDVLWQEWAGQYPEFFDPDMTEGDMVDALVKIYDEAYRAQNAVEYIEKAAVMQPLTMAIYNGYWELPAAPDPLYAAYQKDLADQRGEADREQQRALARQRGEHKRAMAELQKQHERRIQKMNARMKELMRQKDRMELGQKVSAQTKEITVRTRAARRVLGRLNTMFFNQTKTKHVPQALRSLVEQVLSSEDLGDFQTLRKHMREISELESKIEQLEREPALTGEQQKKLDAMRFRYDELASASLAPKAQAEALFKAFEEYNQKANKGATLDADLMKRLSDDIKAMEGKPLSEMGVESIRAVEDFYKLLYHQIHNANTLFAEERAEQISQLGDASVKEVEGSKLLKFLSPKEMEWAGLSAVRSFILKNLKPLTVFEATGSKTLQGLFQRVLDGEGVWANDVQEVHEKIKGIREKYGWQSWKMDERVAVETKSGTVRLSLSEMMSLYAYSFREQAISHLEGGGFVLDPSATAKGKYPLKVLEQKVNDARRYVMDMETMGALASQLTEEQKSYVKEMQAVLSEMGALGNEVSRKLYDMDLFNEKHYFPIKVRSDYLESQTGRTGDPNIKNRGAFKQTVPDADNPLVLEAFDKVFSDHVNSMATYHAFVLPVEDMMRVFNYNPSNATIDEQGNWVVDESAKSYSTVKAAISGRYGEDVVKYIEQVVRDLNGGARRDATASILDSGITAFKRASTMASLSVLIQQPTSLVRAGAYIDYKYLMNTKGFIDLKDHKANWERLCKYAPVGVIKEMGGYDTGVGARTTEYLNAKEYKTLSERAGAFFKPEALGGDANYRAEIFGRGAAFADEMAWIQMFEACVSEQAEKLKKPRDAEAVLTAAGERFTEIVRRTQVYDSTLTRSELMRSKDTGMKMATAFGAEPTTIVSMVADAIIHGERGDVKFLRKSGGALAAAIIINAMAVSLVYAMRDDDEDKTYAEKYPSTLSAEIVEGFIPLSYLPFARDVMSLAQGYEVERSDMTLIGNLFDQVKLLTSSKRSVTDKVLGVTGAVSAFFGLPVTNMVRDAKGLINTFVGQVDTERTTGAGVSAALKEEFTTIFGLFDEQTTNQYQLYDAVMRGDVAHYERVAARYDSEKAVEQALRKALRENDPRIHEAAMARMEGEREVYESLIAQIEGEGHFDRDIIIRAINNQINYINDHAEDETVPKDEAAAAEAEEELHEALYSASDLNAALERGDTEDFIAMADILVYYKIDAGKTEAQAKASVKSSVTRYWKEKWIEAWKNNDTAEVKRIQSVLVSTGLYGDRNQVAELGQGWVKAYAAKTGLVSVSSSQTAGTGRIRLGN